MTKYATSKVGNVDNIGAIPMVVTKFIWGVIWQNILRLKKNLLLLVVESVREMLKKLHVDELLKLKVEDIIKKIKK